MLLPSFISLRRPADHVASPEDIFSSSLGGIFTDDLQNQHGDDPETIIVYRSRKFGELEFRTADVNGEEQRRKFAHYLWNAGILMAELVGGRSTAKVEGGRGRDSGVFTGGESEGESEGNWWTSDEEEQSWSVKGEVVLELGAGVGLAGIVSALSGAQEVTISDYPAPPILDTIKTNVAKNISDHFNPRVQVEGHQWGQLDTSFATATAHRFTRVLAADCLWMPHEHESLARSMLHFLSDAPDARIFCIAGFHSGRAKMAPFFEEVVPKAGLEIKEVYEMDAEGKRREWRAERDGGREDIGERKKWLVVARLKRASVR